MIVVVGLNHRTAPIAVRERLAIPKDQVAHLLEQTVAHAAISEAMLISTCNRVELVVAGHGQQTELVEVGEQATAALAGVAPGVEHHLYIHHGRDAVEHLFKVASSLDSLVLGEPQILGQVKEAYELARKAGTAGPTLNRTVPRAIVAAKRVRTETRVGAGQVSVPSVAVDLARQIFSDLKGRTVVLIGSGEMAEAVIRLLKNAGSRLVIVGRNAARVAVLTKAVGGEARSFAQLAETLVEADVVVTSTSAPGFVIGRDVVASLRRKRRGRSLFFIDLAVPRDVEPQVEDIDSVFLYNIDDFSKLVADSQKSRAREAERAAELIAEETLGWERWAEAEQAKPTIVALRQRLGGVLTRELERSLRGRLKHLSAEDRAALQAMLDAALNKMLHPATRRLREIASDREYEQIRLEQFAMTLNEVFALETADTPLDDEELVSAPRPLEAPPKEDAQDGADEPRAELPASARRALGSGG